MDTKFLGVGASLLIAATGIVALTLAANEYVRAEERELERRVDDLEKNVAVIKQTVQSNQHTLGRIESLLKQNPPITPSRHQLSPVAPMIYLVPLAKWPEAGVLPKGNKPKKKSPSPMQ